MSFAAWMGGRTSRTMTSRPRPRYVWNVFCAVFGLVILLIFAFILYQLLCEFICYQTEQTFMSYDNNIITTSSDSFVVSPSDSDIVDSMQSLDEGTEVVIEVSKISGKVVEVSAKGTLVYQVRKTSYGIIAVAALFFIVMFSFVGLLLYTVNAKNPRGFFRRTQRNFVL